MERVILVQRKLPHERNYLDELASLAEVAGYIPVAKVVQVRKPDSKYEIGKGKVRELAILVRKLKVRKVIFFNELKPVQLHNLMKELGVEVIDRFQLILEIFIKRAGTKEAKLQIELASLRKELSLLKDYIHFAKINEFPGFLSGGEYSLRYHEKRIKRRIARIVRELENIRRAKEYKYDKRALTGVYQVTLTGYTGSGKTTLFNVLSKEEGYVDGKPFATLSTTTRRVRILGHPFLISDTIGFIDSLPPLLLEAFYTTLEEICMADIALILVDASEPLGEVERKLVTSLDTLDEIGATYVNKLIVLNKIDKITDEELKERTDLVKGYFDGYVVAISAERLINLDELKLYLLKVLPEYRSYKLLIPLEDNRLNGLIGEIYENSYIHSVGIKDGMLELKVGAKGAWAPVMKGIVDELGGRFIELEEDLRTKVRT
ncbi:MAG: GTPase HflX [Thermofilum sp. ex4484_15]|nr:MAG: GTPase HflX [Thermofilum sp. ex4484_15]